MVRNAQRPESAALWPGLCLSWEEARGGGCGQGRSNPIAKNCGKISGKLQCRNQTSRSLKEQHFCTGNPRTHLKRLNDGQRVIHSTSGLTSSCQRAFGAPIFHDMSENPPKRPIVLQQLCAKAKGTKKHAKWTGPKKLREMAKLWKIVKNCGPQHPPPSPEEGEGASVAPGFLYKKLLEIFGFWFLGPDSLFCWSHGVCLWVWIRAFCHIAPLRGLQLASLRPCGERIVIEFHSVL